MAAYQEAEALSELKLEFSKETPVSQVLERLSATPPLFYGRPTGFGINQEFAIAPLQNGDEVVLIPSVSSPLLPSDTPPRAIGLSPGGRSS